MSCFGSSFRQQDDGLIKATRGQQSQAHASAARLSRSCPPASPPLARLRPAPPQQPLPQKERRDTAPCQAAETWSRVRPVCQLSRAPSVGPCHTAVLSSECWHSLHHLALAPALKSRSFVHLLFPERGSASWTFPVPDVGARRTQVASVLFGACSSNGVTFPRVVLHSSGETARMCREDAGLRPCQWRRWPAGACACPRPSLLGLGLASASGHQSGRGHAAAGRCRS